MIKGKLISTVAALTEQRAPFAIATVVRAHRPTSAHPGDSAVVHPDGTIDGFVGGVCAESTVRLYSLRAMETGEAVLLRLVPGDGDGGSAPGEPGALDGAVVEHNPCLSGGALEIFIEPQLPAARLVVVGSAPIAVALAEVAGAAGYDVVSSGPESCEPSATDAAVVVAAHGSDEERVLAAALTAGVPYVGLVASPKRGSAVRSELDVPDELRAQLHTPAGLDIGARTPSEVAISILAEIISEAHAGIAPPRLATADPATADPATANPGPATANLATAVDPVCGMTVAASDATIHLDLTDGERVYFCGTGCRDAYATLHAEHL
jgi:xanthine dehydrogenase accessory factor